MSILSHDTFWNAVISLPMTKKMLQLSLKKCGNCGRTVLEAALDDYGGGIQHAESNLRDLSFRRSLCLQSFKRFMDDKDLAPLVVGKPVTAFFNNRLFVVSTDFNFNMFYDTSNDSWTTTRSKGAYGNWALLGYGNLYGSAGAATGVLSTRQICVFFDTRTYVYQPSNDSWTVGADLPTARVGSAVAVLNDTFFVIGGSNNPPVFLAPYAPTAANEQYIPVGYGTPDPTYMLEHYPPKIMLQTPQNQTYNSTNVDLMFLVDKPLNWLAYSLDGNQNVTAMGNNTLIYAGAANISLSDVASGPHNITVYANDTYGNHAAPQIISFTVAVPKPFPTATVAVVSVFMVVVAAVGLFVYFKKHKHT